MVSTLAVTSQVIGFVSFGITLLTLLGVYRDLISTLRHAPKQIPLMLGNLRAELEAERVAIRRRLEQGDEFNVFPVPRGRKRIADWKTRRQNLQSSEAAQILNATINTLWAQFKALEAPFLIASPSRAEHVRRGQVYGLEDIDPAARKRYGYDEEKNDDDPGTPTGAPPDGGIGSPADPLNRYYKTDFTHRFIWWQSQRDLTSLMDQVQRIQLRRIERDAWEANELVKKVVRWIGDDGEGRDGEGGRKRSGGGGPKGGGDGSGSRKRRSMGAGGKGTGRRSGEVTASGVCGRSSDLLAIKIRLGAPRGGRVAARALRRDHVHHLGLGPVLGPAMRMSLLLVLLLVGTRTLDAVAMHGSVVVPTQVLVVRAGGTRLCGPVGLRWSRL